MKTKPQTTNHKLPVIKTNLQEISMLSITSADTMEQAVSVLSKLNTELDRLTADREKLTKPMNEALKEIRSRYKPFESQLEAAIAHVRKQMTAYQTEQVQKAHEEELRIAAQIGDEITIETALVELADIETPDKQVRTGNGMVSFRTITTYEVADITLVPYEYLVVDMAKVKKEKKPIPGIKYGTEQQPINRR